ncbi:MAG: hypothetical protein ACRDZT_08415, partial [Acidimicrobiales bacterium]
MSASSGVSAATASDRSQVNLDQAGETRAAELTEGALVIDVLAGRIVNPEPAPVDGVAHLDRVIAAGLNVVSMTLAAGADNLDVIFDQMYSYFNLLSARPDQTLHVKSVADIAKAHS